MNFKNLIPKSIKRKIKNWYAKRKSKKKKKYYKKHISGKTTEEVFSVIYYHGKTWCPVESKSGKGSTLSFTKQLRPAFSRLIIERNISKIFDAGCGDFNWMKEIDLGNCEYIGGDIVKALINENEKLYGNENRSFVHCDIIHHDIPKVDMIICRDCLFHLPLKDIKLALYNFKRSGSKYLLTTSFPENKQNKDIETGQFRDINLCIYPFNLPDPIYIIDEKVEKIIRRKRILGLWELYSLNLDNLQKIEF